MKKFQNKKPVIAIDGTAGSGKGTLSKNIAKKLNFDHLDTGLLYRYLAYKRIRNEENVDEIDYSKIKKLDLTTREITKMSSIVAKEKATRQKLLGFQRFFANFPPSGFGSVIDGRDIGSVIVPNAEVKFFIDAKLEVRAKRRFLEYSEKGENIGYNYVLEKLKERDKRDMNRKYSPLKIDKKAIMIDTSNKTQEECLNFAMKYLLNFIKNKPINHWIIW